jgi:hypothetical protein
MPLSKAQKAMVQRLQEGHVVTSAQNEKKVLANLKEKGLVQELWGGNEVRYALKNERNVYGV